MVVGCFKVQGYSVYRSTAQPVDKRREVHRVELDVVRPVHEVDGIDSLRQPGKSLLLCTLVDTVVEVFEEVGLTGAIVTVNPDSDVMERFILTYGIENAV